MRALFISATLGVSIFRRLRPVPVGQAIALPRFTHFFLPRIVSFTPVAAGPAGFRLVVPGTALYGLPGTTVPPGNGALRFAGFDGASVTCV